MKIILATLFLLIPINAFAFNLDVVYLNSLSPAQDFNVFNASLYSDTHTAAYSVSPFEDYFPETFTDFSYDGVLKKIVEPGDFLGSSFAPEGIDFASTSEYDIELVGQEYQLFLFYDKDGNQVGSHETSFVNEWFVSDRVLFWRSSDVFLYYAKLPVTTPEPASLLLLGSGLMFMRRKGKKCS